jgi:hypothetical protein
MRPRAQRGHRLIDRHRIGLVHDRDIENRGHPFVVGDGEAVSEYVEADLADRRIHDIAAVGAAALLVRGVLPARLDMPN